MGFLRHRGNADVILDEIWKLTQLASVDEHLLDEQAGAAAQRHDDAAGSDEGALGNNAPVRVATPSPR